MKQSKNQLKQSRGFFVLLILFRDVIFSQTYVATSTRKMRSIWHLLHTLMCSENAERTPPAAVSAFPLWRFILRWQASRSTGNMCSIRILSDWQMATLPWIRPRSGNSADLVLIILTLWGKMSKCPKDVLSATIGITRFMPPASPWNWASYPSFSP